MMTNSHPTWPQGVPSRSLPAKNDGFPPFTQQSAVRMLSDVATIGLQAAPAGQSWPNRRWTIASAAIVSSLGCLAVHIPVLLTEPVFSLTAIAVTGSLVTLGTYLVVTRREQFTGYAFAFAGIFYPLLDMDIYPGWGAYISFAIGGGSVFYTPISWGVLRYGRRSLRGLAEKLFIPTCALLTSGTGLIATSFARPEWYGYPPGTPWLSLWPDRSAAEILAVGISVGFLFVAAYFSSLLLRNARRSMIATRRAQQPFAFFGISLACGSAVIYVVATLAPGQIPFHTLAILVGFLTLGLTGALATAVISQQLANSHLLADIPAVLSPEMLVEYIRNTLRDQSADLLFLDPNSGSLIDQSGRMQQPAVDLADHRFYAWIVGTDGSKIALLTGDELLRDNPELVESLGRLLSIVIDNLRLSALLRMKVAQLTATRTAEQLAFQRAQEKFRRDLHDGIQQTIASVRLDIDGLQYDTSNEDASRALATAVDKLDVALGQVRSLSKGTTPPDLSFGLKSAIERSVSELRLNSEVEIEEADVGILMLPVYYIVREALTNIYKHARASLVRVSICSDGRTVEVRVHDDGVGIASPESGTGISGMRQRVHDLGGSLEIKSDSGKGTTLEASIPCVLP